MKFSDEQIEKISALRTEFVEKIHAFESGVEYGKRIFLPEGSPVTTIFPTWISKLADVINELTIEEMEIGNINISEVDEVDFYFILGGYFERVESALKKVEEKCYPYFYSMVMTYKRKIMELIKK